MTWVLMCKSGKAVFPIAAFTTTERAKAGLRRETRNPINRFLEYELVACELQ